MRTCLHKNFLPLKRLFAGIGLGTILLFFCSIRCTAQTTGIWTWVSGDSTVNHYPVYGTMGVAAPGNSPGSRYGALGWMDASGNFWIYAGLNWVGPGLQDLWMYNPSTKLWTWENGDSTYGQRAVYGSQWTPAAGNTPGLRTDMGGGFADAAGNFWIFGGDGDDASGHVGYMNDLWKYYPGAHQWAWISGNTSAGSAGVYGTKGTGAPGQTPGGRIFPGSWYDGAGNLWIFGGVGYDVNDNQGELNDLWKYNVASNEWTWVNGENTQGFGGNYGTEGVTAPANEPQAREGAALVGDGSGNLYLFGGFTNTYKNDLWKYNIAANEWTWISGSNSDDDPGIYGTMGLNAAGNVPGSRTASNVWVDKQGNFWLFGGKGDDAASNIGELNDLWYYNFSVGQWTWVSGSNTHGSNGLYGTKGVGSTSTNPAGRNSDPNWTDAAGNFWIFGGGITYDDLWEFNLLTILSLSQVTLQAVPQGNENLLTWQTNMETSATDFLVERSTNGVDFSAIGKVRATGNGNNNYSFTDTHPGWGGSTFYRLSVEQQNGDSSYSQTVVLTNPGHTGASIGPNPATTGTTLTVTGDDLLGTSARLLDVDGRTISEQLITSRQQYIDLSHAAAGVYFLQLSNGVILKIMKE